MEPAPPTERPLPDLRILQANERTFLAWVRTGLGLVVIGLGLTRLNAWLDADLTGSPIWTYALGIAFAALGLAVIPIAAWRHTRIYRNLCADRPVLPTPRLAVGLAIALASLGVLTLALVLAAGH
jgi:putative membrane protein